MYTLKEGKRMCGGELEDEVKVCEFGDLLTGQCFEWEKSFSLQDTKTFGSLSGDHNLIHTSDAAAQARGFEAAVVHGVRVIGEISRACGAQFFIEGVVASNLEARFKLAIYHDVVYKFVLTCEAIHDIRGKKLAVFGFGVSCKNTLRIFGKVRLCFP